MINETPLYFGVINEIYIKPIDLLFLNIMRMWGCSWEEVIEDKMQGQREKNI